MRKLKSLFKTFLSKDQTVKQKMNWIFTHIECFRYKSRVNWIKTIYFNLRSLPFKDAKKLPVYIYSNTELRDLSGHVEIIGKITRGMIRIGQYMYRSYAKTRIYNRGTIKLGKGVLILRGCELAVFEKGYLELNPFVFLAENNLVYVYNKIIIGEHTYIAYHSQLFDTDFHYTVNTETGEIRNRISSIILGKYNWVGNKTTIKKGTVTPDNTIVAAPNSMLNKDYRQRIPECSIIGGSPAKLLVSGHRRVFNIDTELMLNRHFATTDRPYCFDMHHGNIDDFCVKNKA